jgi:hypothetical protein
MTERDHVPVRRSRTGTTLRESVPPALGSAENVHARYRRGGLAVRIAVTARADHAGSHVMRVWGSATEPDVSASDEPCHPRRSIVKRCARSRKES